MITHLIALIVGFVVGALVFRNNAAKVNKAKDIVDLIVDKFRS